MARHCSPFWASVKSVMQLAPSSSDVPHAVPGNGEGTIPDPNPFTGGSASKLSLTGRILTSIPPIVVRPLPDPGCWRPQAGPGHRCWRGWWHAGVAERAAGSAPQGTGQACRQDPAACTCGRVVSVLGLRRATQALGVRWREKTLPRAARVNYAIPQVICAARMGSVPGPSA